MRVAIYTRVSTGEQTTENQKRELYKVAGQRHWLDITEFEDHGISGAKGRDKRPAFNELITRCTRGEFDIVMAWSVDRLGRSLSDLIAFMNELNSVGVGLYLHVQAIDTTTPSGRAMFQMVGVFAEFERSMIQERIKAGLSRARARGVRLGARPKVSDKQTAEIKFALDMGESVTALARQYKLSRMTIYRIRGQK